MEQTEYLYSGNAWLKERLDGSEGHLWRKARKLLVFDQDLSSALNLFKFSHRAIKTMSRPEGTVLLGSRHTELDPNEEAEQRSGSSWADDAQNSIRTLLDRIVTRWRPEYLYQKKVNMKNLHNSLTPAPLRYQEKTYDRTILDVSTYDANKALETYRSHLVPLHYHELWCEITNDFSNVDVTLKEREARIDFELFYDKTTLDEEEDTALIFARSRVTFEDSYKALSRKFGLFDLVLIKVNTREYFGMIVHVEHIKVKISNEYELSETNRTAPSNHGQLKFDLQTTIGVYVSQACSKDIQDFREHHKDKNVSIAKLCNITSSRRMISAIYSLHEWPQYRSLLKPTLEDPYFQLPQDYNPSNVQSTNKFNSAQSQTIAIAEHMFDDLQERLHIVHGPPGTGKSRTIAGIVLKLLSKLSTPGHKQKILLCAPSNNACDELSRRILDEFEKQNVPYKNGTLIRVGCQPPDDYRLSDHFLDFIILQEIVNSLKMDSQQKISVRQIASRMIRHAKIVVSTLNYCGSARLHQLKSTTAFIIIDEASQSLEADFLLPLRFKCTKIMMVGDPLQLPPCVLSQAGKLYGLSESLYSRLYSSFEQHPNSPISMLDIQYRMHPKICEFPAEHFYNDRLSTDPSIERRMRSFRLHPLYVYEMLKSPHYPDDAGSSYNPGEAKFVQYFCQMLIEYLVEHFVSYSNENDGADMASDTLSSSDSDVEENVDEEDSDTDGDNEESIDKKDMSEKEELEFLQVDDPRSIAAQQRIGVITPYKAQLRLLRQYLPPYIEIMTADSSQGKEKDIVIISCVRSGGTIGFLDDMNRLNVMLTRAKYGLYVVGNMSQLAASNESWRAFVDRAHAKKILETIDSYKPDLPYLYRIYTAEEHG